MGKIQNSVKLVNPLYVKYFRIHYQKFSVVPSYLKAIFLFLEMNYEVSNHSHYQNPELPEYFNHFGIICERKIKFPMTLISNLGSKR